MTSIFFQSILFGWFVYSLYLVAVDNTLSTDMKILGETINILCLGFIASNMLNQTHHFMFFLIGFFLLGWFIYYTPIDFLNTGYTKWEKRLYVTVDVSMIIFLSSALFFGFSMKNHDELKSNLESLRIHDKYELRLWRG